MKASDRKNKKIGRYWFNKTRILRKRANFELYTFFLLIDQNDTNLRIMYIEMQVGLSECHHQKKN